MSNDTTNVFVYVIGFWTMLTIISNMAYPVLEEQMYRTSISEFYPDSENENVKEGDSRFATLIKNVFSSWEDIPVLNIFVPLIKITTFQYSPLIPASVSILLGMVSILSAFIVITIVRG